METHRHLALAQPLTPCWSDKEYHGSSEVPLPPDQETAKTHVLLRATVESIRTAAGPQKRIAAHLGELNHDQERRMAAEPSVFYNRQGDARQWLLFPEDDTPLSDDPNVARIRLDTVSWTNGRRFGDVWLARWLWQFLELDQIVARHLPHNHVRSAVSRGCHRRRSHQSFAFGPCSEYALAEHWYASTGLEDLLGIPDAEVTKDRLYRTLDPLQAAQEKIENELKKRFGVLFQLEYDLLLYDLTSTHWKARSRRTDYLAAAIHATIVATTRPSRRGSGGDA